MTVKEGLVGCWYNDYYIYVTSNKDDWTFNCRAHVTQILTDFKRALTRPKRPLTAWTRERPTRTVRVTAAVMRDVLFHTASGGSQLKMCRHMIGSRTTNTQLASACCRCIFVQFLCPLPAKRIRFGHYVRPQVTEDMLLVNSLGHMD
jgi:hypothetical protein